MPRRSTPRTRCAVRAADHHDQDPGRQDRRGHRAQGQDDQPDPGRHRRRDHHRGRRHDLHRCHRRRRRPRPRGRSINAIANPTMPEVGERYLGTVVKTTTFGAFVSLLPGKDGLLHICKLRALAGGKRVENVEDVVKVGQKIQVEISEIDDRGKLSLVPVVEEPATPAATQDDAAEKSARPGRQSRDEGPRLRCRTKPGDDPHPAGRSRTTAARWSAGPPHRPARRAAGRHRGDARRPLRVLGVWVGVGSRDESPRLSGASHFLEHLLFKGTRAAHRAGHLGRASTRSAASSTRSPPRSTPASTRGCSTRTCRWPSTCIGDMVTSSLIAAADVEAEREVILDEIAMHDDDPDDVVHDLFAEKAWGSSPLGPADRRHASSRSATLTRAQIAALLPVPLHAREHRRRGRRQRRPRGRRTPGAQGVLAAELPGRRRGAAARRSAAASGPAVRRPGTSSSSRPFEQANLVLGVNGLVRTDERRYALGVLNAALGGGTSLAAVPGGPREARAGLLGLLLRRPLRRRRHVRGLRVGCLPSKVDEVLAVVPRRARPGRRATGITADGAASAARASCAAALVLGLEDSGSRMSRIGEGRAGLRRAAEHRRGAAPHRRRHPRRRPRAGRASCWPAAARWPSVGPFDDDATPAAVASGRTFAHLRDSTRDADQGRRARRPRPGGPEVCRAVEAADDLELVAAVDAGDPLSSCSPSRRRGGRRLHPPRRGDGQPGVLRRPRHPRRGRHHRLRRRPAGASCAAGSTRRPGTGVLVAPNFSIGAVLMMRFAAAGRAVLRVGRDRRAAPPGQGRRAVRHRPSYGGAGRRGRAPGRAARRCPTPPRPALDGARGADVDGHPRARPAAPRAGRPPGGHPRRRGGDADHPARLDGPCVVHARACCSACAGSRTGPG